MRNLLVIISLALLLSPLSSFAANENTYTAHLEADDSEYFYFADDPHFDLGTSATWEFWFRAETVTGNDSIIAKRTNADSGYYDLILDDTNYFNIYNDTDNAVFAETIPTATWTHYAITYNNGTWLFYIDGTYDDTDSTTPTTLSGSTGDFTIGSRDLTVPDQFYDGEIDDVRVWNDVRTAQEISDYYDCQLAGDEDDLVAYYQFNNDATDETALNHDLTLVNSPTYQSGTLPFTDDCPPPVGGGGSTTTATTTDLAWYSDDLTIITGKTEHYETSSTTPDWTRYHYYHIPFFAWVIIFSGILIIGSRLILEIIIRFRNGKFR